MSERLTGALSRLSRREAVLLGALALVGVPVALWALVVAPMEARRDAAMDQLGRAQEEQVWLRERMVEWQALAAGPAVSVPAAAPAGLAGFEAALRDAGLRAQIVDLAPRAGQDGIRLALEDVTFVDAARFLQTMPEALGHEIDRLSLSARDVAGQVDMVLEARALDG